MSDLAAAVLANLAISVLSLAGILLLFARRLTARGELALLSFAAGVLLSAALLDLLPEAIAEAPEDSNVLWATLLAMVGFFFLERRILGFHAHGEELDRHGHGHGDDHGAAGHESGSAASSRALVLVGDGLHNFVDGVAIAAAFIASPALGVSTAVAVAAHEVPQEIADFGILTRGGYSRRRALVLNFLSALTAVVGALAVFAIGSPVEDNIAWFVAATAGMFLYIAAADLLPELHRHGPRPGAGRGPPVGLVGALFLAGIAVVVLLGHLVPE